MIVKDERWIIATRTLPIRYIADFRYEFYMTGDLTEELHDAYKFIEEKDAENFIRDNLGVKFEDYEPRLVLFNDEVI